MNRHVLRDYLVGAASLLFTLVISCATPAAEAATARYDFQLQASALGAGGAFGIGALPAGPLQGHLAFSYDGTPDMLALIDVSDFSLSVGDVTFDTAGLVITLADFRPGIAGGPLASATLLALSDTRFVQIDTDAGWAAGSVFASDCLPGGSALDTRWDALGRLRDLGRGTAERWLEDNLAAVGTRPTLDLTRFARPAVEIRAEDG